MSNTLPASQRVKVDGKLFRRGNERLRIQGVTYGPFRPNAAGELLPERRVVAADFAQMQAAAINAIRTYNPPPVWLLDLAQQNRLTVLMEIPCPRHLDFLECAATRRDARERVVSAVRVTRDHPALLGCCVGNEIPSELVRWYGARRVERFIRELADAARQVDPGILVTYSSYPPTEYLDMPFLDFAMFNVYLHDQPTFRRYLVRLANRFFDRPLVLGEIGMDTLRHGEEEQSRFLAGHLRETALAGMAGTFVFAWTDDWFTQGWQIENWAFGITRRDRTAKPSCAAVSQVFGRPPAALLERTPRVSVVVCSYNGGRTLEQCLRSLGGLAYPDYEVILVDDGSTDETQAIAGRFPQVRNLRQKNCGLSAARNAGLAAATGEIIAYTDSDCFVDADWLTLLVNQLARREAAAVGGPNLTPEDGWLAGCIACAPGQPNHVLESDEEAEHIPGCNMAFRRDALQAVGGFDPLFRKAGDDVDLCWRLQAAGYRVTFAPGAFVWHYRRQGVRAYLRQQVGYGEAEALLAQKHPERYSVFGGSIWRGVIYGGGLSGLRLGRSRVHGGIFGQGLFQTLYRPLPAHWAMLPATLEWQVLTVLLALGGLAGLPTLDDAAVMAALTLLVTALQAIQARPDPRREGFGTRCVIALLCWLQPLVRSGQRYRIRFITPAVKAPSDGPDSAWQGRVERYITMDGVNRATLVSRAAEDLRRRGHHPLLDTGWSSWDLEVVCTHGVCLQVRTVQEWYEGNSAQIAVEYRLRRSASLHALAGIAFAIVLVPVLARGREVHSREVIIYTLAAMLLASWVWLWRHGRRVAGRVRSYIDETARGLGMTPFHPIKKSPEESK